MILVVGGSHQGKLAYACQRLWIPKEDFVDGSDCTLEELYHCKGIYRFHAFIKKSLKAGIDLDGLPDLLQKKNSEIVIIVNEIGYGIVPIDPFEREYREQLGRICGHLAAASREVHRVVCGLGMVIKDTTKDDQERGRSLP